MPRRYAGALLAMAVVAAACAGPAAGGPSGSPALRKITFLTPNPSAIVVFNLCAAVGQGYFAQEGIDVSFQALDGSGPVLQAMAAGQAQIGLPGPGPVLIARARGESPVMFYNMYPQSLFGLVAPTGTKVQTLADLKGTVVGVGTAEGAEVPFARSILLDAGLKEGTDYKFLPVGDGGPAAAAFGRKEIAAYAAAVPDVAIMRARGLTLLDLTPAKYLAFFGNGYATLQSTIDKDRALIAGFTRALVKGTKFAMGNKAATLADCAKLNPQEATDASLASALFDASMARSMPLGGGIQGTFSPAAWKAWEDSLLASGGLKASVGDLSKVYTNTFVEQAQ